jgi:hypothetical protein
MQCISWHILLLPPLWASTPTLVFYFFYRGCWTRGVRTNALDTIVVVVSYFAINVEMRCIMGVEVERIGFSGTECTGTGCWVFKIEVWEFSS